MNKALFLICISIILCAACSNDESQKVDSFPEIGEVTSYEKVNQLQQVSIKTEKKEYPNDVKNINLELINNTNKEYIYENYFELEIFKDGKWYQIGQKDDEDWSDKTLKLKPQSEKVQKQDVKTWYGEKLEPGKYRIYKSIVYMESEKDWDYDTWDLIAEFTIKK